MSHPRTDDSALRNYKKTSQKLSLVRNFAFSILFSILDENFLLYVYTVLLY